MRAILLLGATGQRGTAVLRAWERSASNDLALHCLARRDGFEHASARVFQGDLASLPASFLPRDEHVVVHCAVKQVDRDGSGFEENVANARRLLERLDPSLCRGIVYASSASVYGRGPHRNVGEDALPAPRTPLARSRFESERLLCAWGREHGASVFALRTRFLLSSGDAAFWRALGSLARGPLVPGSG